MSNTIQARLDEETKALRDDLKKRLGWTDARIVREAIKVLASVTPPNGSQRKLTGVGKYDSGIADLGSNKEHLAELGKNSMGNR